MRKAVYLLLSLGIMASITACSTSIGAERAAAETQTRTIETAQAESEKNETETVTSAAGDAEPASTEAAGSRILIAYFSRWGNTNYDDGVDATSSASIVVDDSERYGTTEYEARMIQELTGGKLHLIETEDSYSTDFEEVVSKNHEEADQGILPELKAGDLDMADYDVIFVGYPVWATDAPQAVHSFLQGYDLTGKTVIPFCTHDGYGAGSSYSTIAGLCPGAALLDGLALESTEVPTAQDTVKQWVESLGLPVAENGQTPIRITIGDQVLDGVLYDNAEARQFLAMLPQTVSMAGFGGREFYGGIDGEIQTEGEGRYSFEDGHITYCPANNTAAIFYAQTDRPNLTMEVFPMGKVTSDLSVFDQLPGNVDITFSLAE